jgi:glycerol-3-phosphate dehydrogenase (NAD(P)+)
MALNKISVIGAGAWGCVIADVLAQKHHEITLLSSRSDFVESFNRSHISSSFSNITLAKNIIATKNFSLLRESEVIFIVSNTAKVEEIFQKISKKISQDSIVVLCSKGFAEDGRLFSKIFQSQFPNQKFAILSGPNFAVEIAQKKLATTTIASEDLVVAKKISDVITTSYFFPKTSQDIITTQVSGAIKNIIAICCGLVDGLDLGANCKATLINKGLEEIFYISKSLGGSPKEELLSPAVFGDLFLTCSSDKSRNYSYGFNIALGNNIKNTEVTCEGVRAAKILQKFLNKYHINSAPISLCLFVQDLIIKNIGIIDIKQSISNIFAKNSSLHETFQKTVEIQSD